MPYRHSHSHAIFQHTWEIVRNWRHPFLVADVRAADEDLCLRTVRRHLYGLELMGLVKRIDCEPIRFVVTVQPRKDLL